MAFTKFIYNLINWKNKSESLTTPLGATNLNKMDSAIKTIGDNLNAAYDELSEGKLDKDTANTMVKDVTYNDNSGIFTITKLNGTTLTIDTKLEKIVTNWKYDKDSQKLILTLDDGTTQEVDLSALITQYEFKDSDTIAFTVESDGSVTANVKDGSITDKKIQPNYLADIKTQASNAETSAQNASDYADDASYDAKLAQSYAIGGSGIRDGESTSNAKYYSEQANKEANNASGFAESASSFAENANRSASYASSYANTASTHATNAEASAQSANKSANSASGYAENANTSAELANRSASYASSYANTASTHASNASASAQSASDSASAAEESAKNAKAEADKIVEIAGGDIVLQSEKGEANGVAPLDSNALIPSKYVPSGAGRKYCFVGSDSTNSAGWYKFASGTLSNNDNINVMFGLTSNYIQYFSGILTFQARCENNTFTVWKMSWHTRIGFNADDVICVVDGMSYTLYVKLRTLQWGRIMIERLMESTRDKADASAYITLHNNNVVESTEPVATVASTDGATVQYANQLSEAVNIGKASFNGGSDISLADIMGRAITNNCFTDNDGKWTKFATITISSAWSLCCGILNVLDNEQRAIAGQLLFHVRSLDTISSEVFFLGWTNLHYSALQDKVVAVKVSDGVFDLYVCPPESHTQLVFALADGMYPEKITFHNYQPYVDSVTPAYTSSLGGYVAIADKLNITQLYQKNIDELLTAGMEYWADGGNGCTGDIPPNTNAFHLKTFKNALNYICHRLINQDGTIYTRVYKGSAWTDWSEIATTNSNVASATKAEQDGEGNVIPDTYMTQSNPTGSGAFSMNRRSGSDIGTNSSTLGLRNTASGSSSHAEGSNNTASGNFSHVEGSTSKSTGRYAHAEGWHTESNGEGAHTEGNHTTANGDYSHAGGSNTIANYENQTVIGEYNDNKEENIFEVGNGSYDSTTGTVRSNALELTREGDLKVAGGFKGNADTATKATQDGNGKVIADTYATLSDLNSASQNLTNSINQLNLNKASIHTKSITSTGSASFTVKVGSIIFITTGQATSTGNHLMIAQVRSEGVLSDIYKSSTSAAISLSLSALTLSVGIGSSSGATITVLS